MVRFRCVVHAIIPSIIIAMLVLTSGCEPGEPSFDKFAAYSPYEAVSAADLDYLDAEFDYYDYVDTDVLTTPTGIANAIRDWQDARMILAVDPESLPDTSYPMRWNRIMPGVYQVPDLIRSRHLPDESIMKIYGVCWDFAAIFAALAQEHGLEVRITAWKVYLSDRPDLQDPEHPITNWNDGADKGMSPEESQALMARLGSLGYDIPERFVQDAMRETYVHYRPEVLIGEEWIPFDATDPTDGYANDDNFTVVAWDEGLDTSVSVRR